MRNDYASGEELLLLRWQLQRKHGDGPLPEGEPGEPFPHWQIDMAMVEAMLTARTRPELIYASIVTDRIVTATNMGQLTAEDRAEWQTACEEYTELARLARALDRAATRVGAKRVADYLNFRINLDPAEDDEDEEETD